MRLAIIRRNEDHVAFVVVMFAEEPHRNQACSFGFDVKDRIGTEMFGVDDFAFPFAAVAADGNVLGTDTDRLRSCVANTGAVHEIHLRRSDEARDKQIVRLVIEFHRRTDLLDAAGIEDNDTVSKRHGLNLIMRDIDHRRLELAV